MENNTGSIPLMLTLREASERTGLSYGSLRLMCLRGEIAHIRVGSKYFVNGDRLADYLNGSTGMKGGQACVIR